MVVVLVITDRVGDGRWPPSGAGLQPEHSVTKIAVATAAGRTPGRTRLNSTCTTVTSGRRVPARLRALLRRYVGLSSLPNGSDARIPQKIQRHLPLRMFGGARDSRSAPAGR